MKNLGFYLTIMVIVCFFLLQTIFLFQEFGVVFSSQYALIISYLPISFTTVLYLTLVVQIWIEIRNLEEFHVDKFTLFIFIFSSMLRIRPGIFGEKIFLVLMALAGISIIILLFAFKPKIPGTKLSWACLGVVSGLISVVLLTIVELSIRSPWEPFPLVQNSIVFTTARLMVTEFSAVPAEELLFRGFLWGYLRRIGWKENNVCIVQGLLFWLAHISRIITPFAFFVALPVLTFISSKLVIKSKQLFPSVLSHSIINMLARSLSLATF